MRFKSSGMSNSGMSSLIVFFKHFFMSFFKPHFPSYSERLIKELNFGRGLGWGWAGYLNEVNLGYLLKVFLKQFLTVFKNSLGCLCTQFILDKVVVLVRDLHS